MKILHIAREPGTAVVAERLLHAIAHDVTPVAVPTPAAALHWLQENRDAAVVIAEIDALTCAGFVEQLRGAGLTTPIVLVAGATQLRQARIALESGVDAFVLAGPSIEGTLSRAVTAAIASERGRRQLVTQVVNEFGADQARTSDPDALLAASRRQIDEWAASVQTMAAAWFADIDARHSASLARETKTCMALQNRLLELEGALRKADERRATEAASFADQLARRHAEFTTSLAQAAHARDVLASEANVIAASLEEERQARHAEAAIAAERLREREEELQAELREANVRRAALEQALAEADAAHQDTRRRATLDLAAANERQAALEDLLTQETDRRSALEKKLAAAAADARDADQRHANELANAAAAAREADQRHVDELAAAAAAARESDQRHANELADAAAAARDADQRHANELAAARAALANLQEQYDAAQEDSATARIGFERQLAAAETARRDADHRHASELSFAGAQLGALQATHDATLVEHAIERTTLEHRLSDAVAEHATTQGQLRQLRNTLEEERRAHQRARVTAEAELQRVSAEHEHLRQSFDRLQSSFQTLEAVAGEHASERTRLETVVAQREFHLSAMTERHRIAEAAAEETATRLQHEIDALHKELDASRTHAEALRGVAERVPDLQTQLERTQSEKRRQFERAPYALCRCAPDGSIIEANHTFVTLLGCRRLEELQKKKFVAAALDRAGDLGWLLDRARTTQKTETVETAWKARDGRRLLVRLQALVSPTGSIDIVAEDITGVRTLEDRLRQSQRLEAVGRLAPEVAGTCEALLNDVASGAREWLVKAGSDPGLRWLAERLMTDVTRAAAFMRQLGKYGDEQVRSLEPVSAQRVLRDLAPVLQQIVGEHIDLVLPKASGPFTVDVDAERLERVLINVAGYARERIPAGGQVRIDLATTAVGRRFAAGYASVRPGDHVLITVTEVPTAAADPRGSSERRRRSDKPGVDLGVLVDLIASCGGHLWMEAQPAGNMVVKIHLPKPSAISDEERRTGRLSKWFRSPPATKLHA